MAKKNRKRHGIPLLIVVGLISMIAFYFLFGGLMLLRYLLGAIMFATITVTLIKFLNKNYGKKRIG